MNTQGRSSDKSSDSHTEISATGIMETTYCNDVFLIEDDLDIREALVEILENEGVKVRSFQNGAQGLSSLIQSKELPCLVLLDLMMPVMDGHEFLEKKNAEFRFKEVPVVVMTADAFTHQNLSKLPEVAGLIKKPIDIDYLVQVVNSYTTTRGSL